MLIDDKKQTLEILNTLIFELSTKIRILYLFEKNKIEYDEILKLEKTKIKYLEHVVRINNEIKELEK